MDALHDDIAHLYRRAGFGATAAELEAGAAAGYDATVEALVAGLAGPDPGGDAVALPQLSWSTAPAGPPGSAARKAQLQSVQHQYRDLQLWWAQRMISTSTPLREKMALLWHGHFATAFSKVHDAAAMHQQNEVLRSGAGGSFEALCVAVAKGPAMMRWLDTVRDKASHPNENFGRELLELFTMGVGTYSQADVVSSARGFTGWVADRAGAWHLQAGAHDNGTKTFLGHTGNLSGEDIIHLAVTSAVSPRFVVAKVWSHLAYPVSPTDAVVTELLGAYGAGMDLTSLVRAALLHPAFRSSTARQGLVKQPIEYLVGAARSLGLQATGSRPGQSMASHNADLPTLSTGLGQTLFDPPSVGGWGQNAYWLDTATAQARLQAANSLASRADLSALSALTPSARPGALATQLGLGGWWSTTSSALNHTVSDPVSLVGTALTSPEYVLA